MTLYVLLRALLLSVKFALEFYTCSKRSDVWLIAGQRNFILRMMDYELRSMLFLPLMGKCLVIIMMVTETLGGLGFQYRYTLRQGSDKN